MNIVERKSGVTSPAAAARNSTAAWTKRRSPSMAMRARNRRKTSFAESATTLRRPPGAELDRARTARQAERGPVLREPQGRGAALRAEHPGCGAEPPFDQPAGADVLLLGLDPPRADAEREAEDVQHDERRDQGGDNVEVQGHDR